MQYGQVRPNGRSRDCGALKFRKTCRKSMVSSRWEQRRTARSRTRFSAATTQDSTTTPHSSVPHLRVIVSRKSKKRTKNTEKGAPTCAMATYPILSLEQTAARRNGG